MILRLYTEDKNRADLIPLIDTYFEGYTLVPAEGVWKGQPEHALIIEIAVIPNGTDFYPQQCLDTRTWAAELAHHIKGLNGQESVLIVELAATNYLV